MLPRLLVLVIAHTLCAQDVELPTPPVAPTVIVPPLEKSAARDAITPSWYDTSNRDTVRTLYNNVWAPSRAQTIGWSGSVSGCQAGAVSASWQNSVITGLNFIRNLAGIGGSVALNPANSLKGQEAALMFSANRSINHFPPSNWTCFTANGYQAAGNSNICLSSGQLNPGCLELYMDDFGSNNTAVGHRRWILYPQTQSFGNGDVPVTPGYSSGNALWVFDGNYGGTRPATRESFVAWPPPGYFPYQMLPVRWSFSYPSASFTVATVTMTKNGVNVPTSLELVQNGFGENTVVWYDSSKNPSSVPGDAAPAQDDVYTISINNVGIGGQLQNVPYTVRVFNPAVGAISARVGIFRSGYYWIEDVDGDRQFSLPADKAFAFGGVPGDVPITGDWNGSGRSKVGVYRPSNGTFVLDYDGDGLFTIADKVYNLGVGIDPTDKPVTGDWNGDGKSKVGLFRQGFFWILDTNGNGSFQSGLDQTFAFGGDAGDVPVTGDWDGNGRTDLGLFRQGFYWILDYNGTGSIDNVNAAGGDKAFAYGGLQGDVPVVGDWNGDGKSKVGIFRAGFFWVLDANGDYQFNGTGAGQDLAFAFGGSLGDKPLVGKW